MGKPGRYELRSDTTVAEAVQIAGGFTAQSKHSQVVLFRRVNDDLVETRLLNLKKMLKQNGLKEDAHLRPGDLVYVPQNTISKMSRFLSRAFRRHVHEFFTILERDSFPSRMADKEPIRGRTQQQIPTARELAMVLFRQRRVFVWVSGLVFAAATLYAVFGTKYQANMKVLVRRGRADAPVSTGANAPLDLTHLTITEEELNSEVELLRDGDVLRAVALQTGIGGHDWWKFLRFGEGT